MTFSPVLHRVSQPGWWLVRWTAFGAKIYYGGKLYFQNGHYKNAANDRNCLFPATGCITLLLSCSYMDFDFCFFYIERGILICWWLTLRGREIYLLRSARDWNYPLYSCWLSAPGWPGKRDYMEKFQPGSCNQALRLTGIKSCVDVCFK